MAESDSVKLAVLEVRLQTAEEDVREIKREIREIKLAQQSEHQGLTRPERIALAASASAVIGAIIGVTKTSVSPKAIMLSHHENSEHKIEQIKKIDRFHIEQYARFIEKLKSIKEGDGTLLDNCMILRERGIGDGNGITTTSCQSSSPAAAGAPSTRAATSCAGEDTPLCNLYVSMLDRMGVKVPRFGDSTCAVGGLNDLMWMQ